MVWGPSTTGGRGGGLQGPGRLITGHRPTGRDRFTSRGSARPGHSLGPTQEPSQFIWPHIERADTRPRGRLRAALGPHGCNTPHTRRSRVMRSFPEQMSCLPGPADTAVSGAQVKAPSPGQAVHAAHSGHRQELPGNDLAALLPQAW